MVYTLGRCEKDQFTLRNIDLSLKKSKITESFDQKLVDHYTKTCKSSFVVVWLVSLKKKKNCNEVSNSSNMRK